MKNNMDQPSPGDIDLSVLRTPIPTSVTGFMGVMKAFGDGTPEMRRVLEKECDLIYECKVCRNIFRDVVNLMTHKRLYCKTAFNSTRDFHFPDNGFINPNISSVIEQENRTVTQEAKREKSSGELPPKDLGGLVQKMRLKQLMSGTMKPGDYYELVSSKVTLEDIMRQRHLLYLEQIPQSSVAMYQTVDLVTSTDPDTPDVPLQGEPMKREVDEVNKLSTKNVVLGPDGKALKIAEFRDTVSKDEFDVDSLEELLMLCHYEQEAVDKPHECALCDCRFDTEKTLILHIRLKHISSTKVYQCPSCSETFLQAAHVIKHLSNDHKKSIKKIRSLREAIHKRHIRLDEVQVKGPSRELHRLQTEKERIDAENKAYLENMANFDNTNQSMCTYCNKVFERKAVLTSHKASCRLKYEKSLLSGSQQVEGKPGVGPITSTAPTTTGAKRGPKPKENGTKEKVELNQDENSSSSTVISSDGGGSNEGGSVAAENGENSNGRKRKSVKSGTAISTVAKKSKKEEQQQQHSKVSELMEKEIWNADNEDRDDSYFSFDDKAPEDARDEPYKRRFPCDICNKSFSTMSNLKRHNVMFHYFQNRYSCRMCNVAVGMKKKDALAHLRDEHKLDQEEHEMKALLKHEKNEVSSSEVLDLDLDETSSNLDRTMVSGANSPVSQGNSTATAISSNSSPAESMAANNSNSSGVGSGSSPSAGETPVVRKRGRPKGSFKKAKPVVTPVDRELRADSAASKKESDQSDFSEFVEVKKKSVPIAPAPPQLMDTNSSSSSTAAAAAASSRPIRNRTKPKDKDFVYDLSLLKGDFIYEDEAMDTALSESILSASAQAPLNSFTGAASSSSTTSCSSSLGSLIPDKIFRNRTSSADPPSRQQSLDESCGEGTTIAAPLAGQKRGIGRPPKVKTDRQGEKSSAEGSLKLKSNGKIGFSKNVVIPTRIIEHRHSVDQRKVAQTKNAEVRRNSIEIMTKGGNVGLNNVKENNRPMMGGGGGGAPLGMIGNIMEPMGRVLNRENGGGGALIKDFTLGGESARRHFVSDVVAQSDVGGLGLGMGAAVDHILLNGRSLGEILSMSTNGVVVQPGAPAMED